MPRTLFRGISGEQIPQQHPWLYSRAAQTMAQHSETQMTFEVLTHTCISVAFCPDFCTNMIWKGKNWARTHWADALSLFHPHADALLGHLRKSVARKQLPLRAKWVANVLACVVSSAVVNRIYFPGKGKRKKRMGMLKSAKQIFTTPSEALHPRQ